MSLKQLLHFLLLGCIIYWVYWFLMFESNPYTYCQEHPDRRLRADYYFCQPFGFNLRKGFIDKNAPTPWMKDQRHVEYLKHREDKLKEDENSKEGVSEPENIDPSYYKNNN
jgi:hypothetical protein